MGVTIKQIKVCTCDVCGKECEEDEGNIQITTGYSIDSRAYVFGNLYAYIPYGTSQGVVCKECKLSYLEKYIAQERNKQ